jgi:hypothetical protein
MQTHETCTEQQAATLAGVSARTLQRFAESGYLEITLDTSGCPLYQRRQIEEIFGAAHRSPSESTSTAEAASAFEQVYAEPAHFTEQPQKSVSTQHNKRETVEVSGHSHATDAFEQLRTAQNALEVERLKNLIAIQERMLDTKDDEIADLKNQRAWLRARVEKLEEKSDRDQILLLSETQTIRSLIAYQESRKSTVRQLLEWIGFSRPDAFPALGQSTPGSASQSGRTIEVRKAANAE